MKIKWNEPFHTEKKLQKLDLTQVSVINLNLSMYFCTFFQSFSEDKIWKNENWKKCLLIKIMLKISKNSRAFQFIHMYIPNKVCNSAILLIFDPAFYTCLLNSVERLTLISNFKNVVTRNKVCDSWILLVGSCIL